MSPSSTIATIATVINHSDGISTSDTLLLRGKPQELNYYPQSFYSQFLTIHSKARLPSPIRGLLPMEKVPGMISMLAGKPNPTLFPITSIAITVRSPLDSGLSQKVLEINGPELEEALQYGPTSGLPKAEQWFKGLQEAAHHRKQGPDWDLAVGSGSQDLLYKAFLALVNPGESAMVEAPVYAGAIPLLLGQGAECIEILSDADGVDASHMRKTLEEWPVGKPKPKVFYTVPVGGNPNGATASLERRLEVLKLAHEHNFIIMEDDPYFYLYFGASARPPSYWELEGRSDQPRGRVLRFDSFSKILSSGLRLGLVTGPKVVVEAINMHSSTANLQVSSTTQAIAYALLSDWGYETFFEHARQVSNFYRIKRDVFAKGLEKHMTGLAEWTIPDAGMFFWIKLCLPSTAAAPEGDSEDVVLQRALEAGVLALPGKCFFADGRATPYVRASFSLLDEEDVEEGLRRLATVVQVAQVARPVAEQSLPPKPSHLAADSVWTNPETQTTCTYDDGDIAWSLASTVLFWGMIGSLYSVLLRHKNALTQLWICMVCVGVVSFQLHIWNHSLAFSETDDHFIGDLKYAAFNGP